MDDGMRKTESEKKPLLLQVVQAQPLTPTLIQVFLELPESIHYHAGQYLQVVMPNEQLVPFSIASAPLGSRQLELHIRHYPENALSAQIINDIQTNRALSVVMPFGQSTYLSIKPDLPIIFMAYGSGFSPIKAVIEQLLMNTCLLPMHLYWSGRVIGDHYLDELTKRWVEHVENFEYTPLLSSDSPMLLKWTGRTGDLVDMIAMDHYPNLSQYQIFAAGPFDMMIQSREIFEKQGLKPGNMYSDAFS